MKNILIVDDDPLMQQVYKDFLENKPLYAIFSSSINEALIHLMKSRFNLIVINLSINQKNCIQFLRLVHYWKPQTPLVFITDEGTGEELSGLEEVVSAILFKPFDKEELLEQIQNFLKQSIS